MRRLFCLLLGASFAALSLLSCDSDPFYTLPSAYRVGAIEGIITVAGEPRQVSIGVREFGGDGRLVARTQSDAQGWYRLEVPSGRYRVELNPRIGRYFSSRDSSGTVLVTWWSVRHDLELSRMLVQVETPPWMEGWWARSLLESPAPYFREHPQDTVENGILEFTHDLIRPGSYWLSLDFAKTPRYWTPGTYDRQEAELVRVDPDQDMVRVVRLSRAAAISGHVRGSWEELSTAPPYIGAINQDDREVARVPLDEDGSFLIPLLYAEPVRLRISESRMPDLWLGGSEESATVLSPDSMQVLSGVQLSEGAIVVNLSGPGSFVEHRAGFLLVDGQGWTHEIYDLQGSTVHITNLHPGDYFLQARGYCHGQPWRPMWFGGSSSLAEATAIRVEAGQATTIEMALETGGSIEGRVLIDDESWATVALFDTLGASYCEVQRWSEDGSYRFSGLADGEYLLADTSRGLYWWFPGTSDVETATRVRIENASAVTGVDWSPRPPDPQRGL